MRLNREIEVKILEVNLDDVEKKLLSVGAKKIFQGEIITEFFDFEDFSIKKRNSILRLRKYGDKSFICLKTSISKGDVKEMEEIETEVIDLEKTKGILLCIGLKIYDRIVKIRKSYEFENVHIELERHIENYSFIPDFIEIESDDKNKIFRVISRLGLKKEDAKPWTIFDVIAHYRNKKV